MVTSWKKLGCAVILPALLLGCEPAAADFQQKALVANPAQFHAERKMDEQEFWRLLDFAHQQAAGDQQQQEALLTQSLEKYSLAEIITFECLLRQQILAADDFTIMAAQKIILGSVTDDSYLYFRCWLIGQGERVFKAALRNPDSLAAIDTAEAYPEFEGLLLVATQAYERKTGKSEDESFPRDVAEARGLTYDGATKTKGKDWTEEQLPQLLPQLWAKHK